MLITDWFGQRIIFPSAVWPIAKHAITFNFIYTRLNEKRFEKICLVQQCLIFGNFVLFTMAHGSNIFSVSSSAYRYTILLVSSTSIVIILFFIRADVVGNYFYYFFFIQTNVSISSEFGCRMSANRHGQITNVNI